MVQFSGASFNQISSRYDLINRILSFGLDVWWRRKVAKLCHSVLDTESRAHGSLGREQVASKTSGSLDSSFHWNDIQILDIATGTGDLLFTLAKEMPQIKRAVGIDIAQDMLAIGQKKLGQLSRRQPVELCYGDAMAIPFAANSFNAATIGFGIRNCPSAAVVLQQMHRVLKPGGIAVVLEFSLPSKRWVRSFALFYLRHILPVIGGLLSGDFAAYRYLNQSIERFPSGDAFLSLMRDAGFLQVKAQELTLGVASVYWGIK